jgi:RNase adapter protein RapZ
VSDAANDGRTSPWVIVTGISGSGRSTALRALEDLGFFCVDNLPASLLGSVYDAMAGRADARAVAIGIDVRAGGFLDDLEAGLAELGDRGVTARLLFLDCSDDVLVRRFAETRRRHPVLDDGTILEAIGAERARMLNIRKRTTLVIDTSELNVHQLKARIQALFGASDSEQMVVTVMSFGFKHGLPRNPDYVFDVRCLSNPHFVPDLRPKTGLHSEVSEYVLRQAGGDAYVETVSSVLRHSLPLHVAEGRALVTIAIGCTGGQHRSVAIARRLAAVVADLNVGRVTTSHRDVKRMSSS